MRDLAYVVERLLLERVGRGAVTAEVPRKRACGLRTGSLQNRMKR